MEQLVKRLSKLSEREQTQLLLSVNMGQYVCIRILGVHDYYGNLALDENDEYYLSGNKDVKFSLINVAQFHLYASGAEPTIVVSMW